MFPSALAAASTRTTMPAEALLLLLLIGIVAVFAPILRLLFGAVAGLLELVGALLSAAALGLGVVALTSILVIAAAGATLHRHGLF